MLSYSDHSPAWFAPKGWNASSSPAGDNPIKYDAARFCLLSHHQLYPSVLPLGLSAALV
jgi:hypothetical protein